MPWQVPITIDGLEYPVTFNTEAEPTQDDLNEAVQSILQQRNQAVPQPTGETPGYLSQLGTALDIGYRQMASGVGATFNALTGDTADVASEMVEQAKLQREQQAAQTPEDVQFMQSLGEAEKAYEEASGPFETIGALAQYPAAVMSQPGAAFKTAVQSAPNVLVSGATQLAGRAIGGILGGAAGIETGPGAILTGLAGYVAGGALSNTLMEAGPAIYDVLYERTQGAASNMTADQIAAYLKENPDVIDEGLKTGAVRGTVIGAVESIGMKGAGRLLTMPERAAARAVQKKLVDAGVDIASKAAVDKALLDPALRTAARTAADAAKSQFSSAGNLARLAGASAIETGAAGAGELAAQAAAGQEVSTKEAFLEMLGEVALSAPMAAATKAIEGAKYMLNPALQNPDTQESAKAANVVIDASASQMAVDIEASRPSLIQAELDRIEKDRAERQAQDEASFQAIRKRREEQALQQLGIPAEQLAPAPTPITPAPEPEPIAEPPVTLSPTMEQAAAPAVETPTPTTPIQDATIQREIPKDGQQERVQTDEGRSSAETGGGYSPVVGRQVEAQEEVVAPPPAAAAPTEAPQPSPNLPALIAVRDNNATPEQVQSLVEQGLVERVGDQNIITEAGVAAMPEDQGPKLTPTERAAEVKGMGVPVVEAPTKAQPKPSEAIIELTELPMYFLRNPQQKKLWNVDELYAEPARISQSISDKIGPQGTAFTVEQLMNQIAALRDFVSSMNGRLLRGGDKGASAKELAENWTTLRGFEALAIDYAAKNPQEWQNYRNRQNELLGLESGADVIAPYPSPDIAPIGKIGKLDKKFSKNWRVIFPNGETALFHPTALRAVSSTIETIGADVIEELTPFTQAQKAIVDKLPELEARDAQRKGLGFDYPRAKIGRFPGDQNVYISRLDQKNVGVLSPDGSIKMLSPEDSLAILSKINDFEKRQAAQMEKRMAVLREEAKKQSESKLYQLTPSGPIVRRLDGKWINNSTGKPLGRSKNDQRLLSQLENNPNIEFYQVVAQSTDGGVSFVPVNRVAQPTNQPFATEPTAAEKPTPDSVAVEPEAPAAQPPAAEQTRAKINLGSLLGAINAMPEGSESRVVPGAETPVTDAKSGYSPNPNWTRKPGFKARAQALFNKYFPQVAIVEAAPGQSFGGSVVMGFTPKDGFGYRIFLHELGHALSDLNPDLFKTRAVRAELDAISQDDFYIKNVLIGRGNKYTLSPGEVIAEFNAARFAFPELNERFPELAAALNAAVSKTPSLNKLSSREAELLSAKVAKAQETGLERLGKSTGGGSAYARQWRRIVDASQSTDEDFIRQVMDEAKQPFVDPDTGELTPWSRAYFGGYSVARQIAEGSIDANLVAQLNKSAPAATEVTTEVTTPEAEAQQKKDEKEAKKLENESRASLARLVAGERGNPVFGNVTMDDGIEALRQLDAAGDLPNIFFTEITTTQEFFSKPENEQNFPDTWAALSAGGKAEGMEEKGTAFVFIDNVGVTNLDRKLATQFGTTPEVAAVRRVATHESIHKAISFLNESEQIALFRYLRELYSPEQLDVLAETYTNFANWRESKSSYLSLIEESLTRTIDSMESLPKDGILGEFIQWLKGIWRKITGKKGEPTLNDMKDVMRLIRNGLRNSTKARADRTISGGVVRYSAVTPQAPATDAEYLAAVEAGDMEKAQRMVDEAARLNTPITRLTQNKTKTPLGDTFEVQTNGPLYRTVTERDWQRIQEQGYIDSDQRGAISLNEGINLATSIAQSLNYAKNGDNVVLLEINPQGLNLHGYDADQYIRTWDKIPLSSVINSGKFIGGETRPSQLAPVVLVDGKPVPLSQRFQTTSPDIRFSLPTLVSESASAFSSGQQAARAISFTPRQLDVYMAVLGAFSTLRRKGKQSATMQELFDAANTLVSGITPNEFSETLQGLYNDNAALLNPGDSTFRVFNRDGELAGAVVLVAKDTSRASLIPPEEIKGITDKLTSDMGKAVTEGEQSPFEGLSFTGNVPKMHARVNFRNVEKAAEDFVNQMIRSRKEKGRTYIEALIDIADMVATDNFTKEYIGGAGMESQGLVLQAIPPPLNNKIYAAQMTNISEADRVRLEDAYRKVSLYYEGIGTVGGTLQGYRAWTATRGKYGWLLDSWKADALKTAEYAVNAQMGGSVSVKINQDLNDAVTGVGKAVADEVSGIVEEDQDAIDLAAGEATLDEKGKTLWEKFKDLIRKRGIAVRALEMIRSARNARMSVSQSERDAISQMSEEELVKYIASLDAEMESVYNSFVEGGKEGTREKRETMVNTAKKRVDKGKNIDVAKDEEPESSEEQVSKAERTAQAILKDLSERYADPMLLSEKESKINEMRELYKQRVRQGVGPEQMTEEYFVNKAKELGADETTAGILWKAAELEIDARETMRQDKILQRKAAVGERADAQAHRIIFATERLKRQSGFSGIDTNPKKDTIIQAFRDQVKNPVSIENFIARLQGLNVSKDVANRLFKAAEREKIDLEAMAQWRANERLISKRLDAEVSDIVAEQADNPVSIEAFAKKLSQFNLTPKQVKRYFDIAARAAVRRVEINNEKAKRIIYERGDIRPDVAEKDVDGDTVIEAFRDQVNSPTEEQAFLERLSKLGVAENVAKDLFNTAARERRDRQRTRVFDMIEGKNAIQKMLREIALARRGIEMPLRNPIPWTELLSKPAKSVDEYRQRVLDGILANPDMESVDNDVKERIADMFTDLWQEQVDKAVNRVIDNYTLQLERAQRRQAGEALNKSRSKVIQHLNLGVLSNDAFIRILGEKFGIKMEMTKEERKHIESLLATLQDESLPKNKRNQASDDLASALMQYTKVGWSARLSLFWAMSVLAGWNTMLAIGMSFMNGANIILVRTPIGILSKMAQGDFKGALDVTFDSLNDIKRYLAAFPEAVDRAWGYITSGKVDLLEAEAAAPDRLFKSWDSLAKYRKVADQMVQDPKMLVRWMGTFMRMIGRIMTALDGFNTIVTKRGHLSMAVRLVAPDKEAFDRIIAKGSIEHYRQMLLASDPYFASMTPEKRRLLNSTAEAMMYQAMNEEGAKLENADFYASESAFTMDPSGLGGMIYGAIKKAEETSKSFAERNLAEKRLEAQGADRLSLENAKLAAAYITHFLAYNAVNYVGLRFARFAANKFNQGLSFIPFLGLTRFWEKSNSKLVDRQEAFTEMIYRNQAVGAVFAILGAMLIRALSEEPDDEKRGWFINGGLENVPTAQRRQLQEGGKLQYRLGVKINGRWLVFSYQNWPWSQLFSALGSTSDMIRFSPEKWREKGPSDILLSVAASGLTSTLDLPALQGLGTVLGRSISSSDPAEDFWTNIGAASANWVGGFIPKPLMDLDYILDSNRRKYTTIWEKTAGVVPFYRRYVGEDYYNILGDPIKRNALPGSREFLLGPTEPAYKILGALNSRDIWLTPANAEQRMVGKGRNRRRLTQQEADAYSLETGKAYKTMILRYGPRALKMSPERARAFLSDKADEVRDRVLMKVYRGYRSRPSAQ